MCLWVSGYGGLFALGLKNFLTPPNCRNRAYLIQRPFDRRGRNTCVDHGTVPLSFGVFSCSKLGGKGGCERNRHWGHRKEKNEDPQKSLVRDDFRLQRKLERRNRAETPSV